MKERGGLKKKNHVIGHKLVVTFFLMLIYIIGRNLQIPWVVVEEEVVKQEALAEYVGNILGKDTSSGSIFALGIGPWITSMILMQLIGSVFKERTRVISTSFMRRITLLFTLVVASIQAAVEVGKMNLVNLTGLPDFLVPVITVMVLIGGSFIVIFIGETNASKGLAGTSALILVNILTGFRTNILAYAKEEQWANPNTRTVLLFGVLPGLYILAIIIVTTLFEKSEMRLPLNRIMIRNELSKDNYIAIKLNPAGTMPVMFAMTFFMIPYYLIEGLMALIGEVPWLLAASKVFRLDNYIGITIYLFTAILLTKGFSNILIDPSNMAKEFQESGDCIAGKRPGEETKRFLKRCIRYCSRRSAAMQCITVGLPLYISVFLQMDSKLFKMPMTMIILTGIILNILEEIRVLKGFKDYKPFL